MFQIAPDLENEIWGNLNRGNLSWGYLHRGALKPSENLNPEGTLTARETKPLYYQIFQASYEILIF